MTQYTPNLNLPYPEAGDAPRGNEQMQAIVEALDANSTPWGYIYANSDFKTDATTGLQTVSMAWGDGFRTSAGGTGSADGGVQIQVAGYYTATAVCRFSLPTPGSFSLGMSGSSGLSTIYGNNYFSNGSGAHTLTNIVKCQAGDIIRMTADGYSQAATIYNRRLFVQWLGTGTSSA